MPEGISGTGGYFGYRRVFRVPEGIFFEFFPFFFLVFLFLVFFLLSFSDFGFLYFWTFGN